MPYNIETVMIMGLVVLPVFLLGMTVFLFINTSQARKAQQKAEDARLVANDKAASLEEALLRLTANQSELKGHLQSLGQSQATSQTQTLKALEERLDKITGKVNVSLSDSAQKTAKSLGELGNRLSVIDKAQKNITELSDQVVGLQQILNNKQERGAFGETQMEDIFRNALPPSAYEFQTHLSNGKSPDAIIKLPNPPGPIVVDSKFPLESYRALREAADEPAQKLAARAFKQAIKKHIKDISQKYIIPGETADSALMFLPSESVYAELYANFSDLVEEGFRSKVWIVSPTTLMATLNTVRAILKDVQMQKQAGVIQTEVSKMMMDVSRLADRVDKLGSHFDQAQRDIGLINTSTSKILRHGEKIEEVKLEGPELETAQDALGEASPDDAF
jgi:DNA recombination protein RmuC